MCNILNKAREFATEAHKEQLRKYTGEPYINHPKRVAQRCLEYTKNLDVISAAWLHDVVEDCNISHLKIEKEFGFKISYLVWELTNPSKDLKGLSRKYRKEFDHKHLAQASVEAQLIKVIDRIDNLTDLIKTCEDKKFVELYKEESRELVKVLFLAPTRLRIELNVLCGPLSRENTRKGWAGFYDPVSDKYITVDIPDNFKLGDPL